MENALELSKKVTLAVMEVVVEKKEWCAHAVLSFLGKSSKFPHVSLEGGYMHLSQIN